MFCLMAAWWFSFLWEWRLFYNLSFYRGKKRAFVKHYKQVFLWLKQNEYCPFSWVFMWTTLAFIWERSVLLIVFGSWVRWIHKQCLGFLKNWCILKRSSWIYFHAIYEQVSCSYEQGSSSKFLWASLWKIILKFSFCIKKHQIKQPILFTFAESFYSFWMRSVCFLKEKLKTSICLN